MPLPISSEDPIVVIVGEDRWDAFSLHDPPTPRDERLFALLAKMGGINEEVEPGTYHFNAADLDANNVVVSLEPVRK